MQHQNKKLEEKKANIQNLLIKNQLHITCHVQKAK